MPELPTLGGGSGPAGERVDRRLQCSADGGRDKRKRTGGHDDCENAAHGRRHAQLLCCGTCAPLVPSVVAIRAPILTPVVAAHAPLMTPLHPDCLGLGFRRGQRRGRQRKTQYGGECAQCPPTRDCFRSDFLTHGLLSEFSMIATQPACTMLPASSAGKCAKVYAGIHWHSRCVAHRTRGAR